MAAVAQRVTHPDREALAVIASERLMGAAVSGQPCQPVREILGSTDIELAYAVQQRTIEHRLGNGAQVVGRKIGLTSPAVQRQLGVDQPDFGVLLDDMDVSALATVPSERLLQPKVEAEIAFMLSADLDLDKLDHDAVRSAVGYAVAALEIVDSRIADWDITITDTVADNASSGLYVLAYRRLTLDHFEPADVRMTMWVEGEVVSEGSGVACLGDPLNALLWLATTAREFGQPLRAGHIVLSGALGRMVAAPAGATVVAELSSLGSVSARFPDKGA